MPIRSIIVCSKCYSVLVYVCGEKIDQGHGQWEEKDGVIEDEDTACEHDSESRDISLYFPIRKVDIPDPQ